MFLCVYSFDSIESFPTNFEGQDLKCHYINYYIIVSINFTFLATLIFMIVNIVRELIPFIVHLSFSFANIISSDFKW